MGIQKYVFYSIHNCDKHPEVPLMEIKYCTEKFLQESGLNHITIRLCGFMQGSYRSICSSDSRGKIGLGNRCTYACCVYGHSRYARLTLIVLRNKKINGKLLTFAGPRAWTTQEVLSSDTVFSVPMTETNSLLGVDQKDLVTLEYLQDYFGNILKNLKDLKAQSKQSDIYF